MTFVVAAWGSVNEAEVLNSVPTANSLQRTFSFDSHPDIVPFDETRYRFANGAVDLDRAAADFSRRRSSKPLLGDDLILVTGAPYGSAGAPPREGDPLDQGLYFHADGLGQATNISVVSTYVWERLPSRIDLPVLRPSGRRALQPYLMQCFAIFALNSLLPDFPVHEETRGCPFDYCHNVEDIDQFFAGGWLCDECETYVRRQRAAGAISREQECSAKRLLNRALGRWPGHGVTSAFVSYGQPDRQLAMWLRTQLEQHGIRCWMYEMGATPGRRTWAEIIEQRREADRVLVLCSAASLNRDGVLKEVEGQVDEDPDRIIPFSLDRDWLDPRFPVMRGRRDLKPFLLDRNYIDLSERDRSQPLKRLLDALAEIN